MFPYYDDDEDLLHRVNDTQETLYAQGEALTDVQEKQESLDQRLSTLESTPLEDESDNENLNTAGLVALGALIGWVGKKLWDWWDD